MKLYIWDDVLWDYTEGVIFVLAHSKRDALRAIKKRDERAWGDCCTSKHRVIYPDQRKTPFVYIQYGGA